ncbi:MAG: S9 family peptidase, partial [Planctomycetota bacterium]
MSLLCFPLFADDPGTTALKYPTTRAGETVDDYHGTKVADPYRWLEDVESEETGKWVAAQNNVTRSYLDVLPTRQGHVDALTELWNYQRFNLPSVR